MRKRGIYFQSFSYIKEARRYIYLAVGLFVLSGIVGAVFNSYFGFFDDVLKDIINKTQGLNMWQIMVYIFYNNVMAALFSLFLGIFIGIFPFFNAITNGLLIGYVLALSYKVTNSVFIIWRLVPHGLFELPAIFISIGLGMKLGMFIFSKNKKEVFMHRLDKSLKVFLSIVIPLLVIAAIIEGILIAFF